MSREEVAIFSQPGLTYVKHPGRPLLLSSTEIAALCLVAAYPLFTALIGWDPIVAVASMIGKQIDPTEMPAPKKL